VLGLSNDAKGLETHALNVEALTRSQDTEIVRLRSALANANKEMEENNVEKERIQHKVFDDVYNAYEAGFNRCLR